MGYTSCFSPCGMLELSSDPSYGEQIYDSLINSLGDNYDVRDGTRAEAWCYAQAMAIAEGRYLIEHAGLQLVPSCVDEMMGDREAEWQIVPGPFDTMDQRRAVLAARMLLPTGASRGALVGALQALLGDDFLALRIVTPAEAVNWPTTLGGQGQNLVPALVERKRLRLTYPVSTGLGSPGVALYALEAGQPALLNGDSLCVEPEVFGRTESVVVSGVTDTQFTATFQQAHESGSLCTTAPFPLWVGTQRTLMVVLASAAAIDPPTRRRIHEQLQRQARGVTVWSVVQSTGSGTAGPFTFDYSPMDTTPIGTVTYV